MLNKKKLKKKQEESEEEKEDEIAQKRFKKGSKTKEIIEHGMHQYGKAEDSLLENSPVNMDRILMNNNPTIQELNSEFTSQSGLTPVREKLKSKFASGQGTAAITAG